MISASPDIRLTKSRRIMWAGHRALMERKRCLKPEYKVPLGKPGCRPESDIELDII
jgi:hypothetical protein